MCVCVCVSAAAAAADRSGIGGRCRSLSCAIFFLLFFHMHTRSFFILCLKIILILRVI